MPLKPSKCAANLSENLRELTQQREMESLRPYLIEEGCFSPNKDTNRCPITIDDLRKLARAWKLTGQFLVCHLIVENVMKSCR